jgi:hypothetical protein
MRTSEMHKLVFTNGFKGENKFVDGRKLISLVHHRILELAVCNELFFTILLGDPKVKTSLYIKKNHIIRLKQERTKTQ